MSSTHSFFTISQFFRNFANFFRRSPVSVFPLSPPPGWVPQTLKRKPGDSSDDKGTIFYVGCTWLAVLLLPGGSWLLAVFISLVHRRFLCLFTFFLILAFLWKLQQFLSPPLELPVHPPPYPNECLRNACKVK